MEYYSLCIIAFLLWYIMLGVYIYGKMYKYLLTKSKNIPGDWQKIRSYALYCSIILPVPTFIISLVSKKFRDTKGFQFTYNDPPYDLLVNQEVDFSSNIDIWYNENPFIACRNNIKDNIIDYWERT